LTREEARVAYLYGLGKDKVPASLLTDDLKLNILATAAQILAKNIATT
jgi:hypothetical protein